MSRKLILGSVSRSRLMGLTPIGMVNGREIFPLHGAEDDGEQDDKPEGESEEDEEEEDESEGEKKPAAKGRRDDNDSSVIRNLRKQNRELLKKQKDREDAEKAKTLADKPEIERLTVERDDAVKALEKLQETHRENSIELAIIRASNSAKSKYAWADIEDVLNDRTLRRAIEIDDDGDISGVEEALKDLAKRKPHFLANAADDDDKSTNGTKGKSTSGTGGKSGGNPGGSGNGKQAVDRQRLNAKYPTLARLPQ